jgi:uncharacterized delta-60 repeat protein
VIVQRLGHLSNSFTVDYTTVSGTAVPGSDYLPQSGTLVFGSGETNHTITVLIIDDTWGEYDEDFFLNLSNPSGVATLVSPASTQVTIVDNDRPGSVDTSFRLATNLVQYASAFGGGVNVQALAVQADGRVLVGGSFVGIIPGVASWNSLARVLQNGTIDTSFRPTFALLLFAFPPESAEVRALSIQPDGKILVGGWFNSVNGVAAQNLARLNADGTLDTSFSGPINTNAQSFAKVTTLALQADGRVFIGGILPDPVGFGFHGLERRNANGTVDGSFVLGPELTNSLIPGSINALLLKPDQKLLVAGNFPGVTNLFRNGLLRLNPDGSNDPTFQAGPVAENAISGSLEALALQAGGKMLVAGDFTQVDGLPRNAIARFNSDGTVDLGFNQTAPPSGSVASWRDIRTIALQPDGKIIVGGVFVRNDGFWQVGVGRLNPDGSVDRFFDSGGNWDPSVGNVAQVAVLSDGQILVGGNFTIFNGVAGGSVARLNGGELFVIQSLTKRLDGTAELVFTAPVAGQYVLEASSDLSHWTALSTNSVVTGTTNLVEPAAPGVERRFYRMTIHP